MLYGSQIQTMMPKLHSTNFPGMELIRPMYLIREADIKTWRDVNGLHFIQCACKFTDSCTTCGNEENRSKRAEIKELIQTLKSEKIRRWRPTFSAAWKMSTWIRSSPTKAREENLVPGGIRPCRAGKMTLLNHLRAILTIALDGKK